jgi:Prenyltransferase and squalene oxidase repeat
MTSAESTRGSLKPMVGASFVADVCLPFLKQAQNHDGGWGFRAGAESRAEATSWALLALREIGGSREEFAGGTRFLRSIQRPDGSWSAAPGQTVGCWATSLACWALVHDAESQNALAAGLRWICADWPEDLSVVRRTIRKVRSLAKREPVSRQDDSMRGWGWTPNTASWVEPTAFGLLALEQAPKELWPSAASERLGFARRMLYNRMCPGGGWNCGNPMVYGVAGDASIPQTAWALLALRNEPQREEQRLSIQWLEKALESATGAASIALGGICLRAYGQAWPDGVRRLQEGYQANSFLGGVTTMSWVSLALRERPWLRATGKS